MNSFLTNTMASSRALQLTGAIVFVCMAVVAAQAAEEATTCDQLTNTFNLCSSYLRNGGSVAAECCQEVKTLSGGVKNTKGRQTACECLKQAISSISDIKLNYLNELPRKCGVSIPYMINSRVDCRSMK